MAIMLRVCPRSNVLFQLFKPFVQRPFPIRFVNDSSGYDGDGKTTVSVLNRDERELLLIDTYSSAGFRLNSGLFVVGPLAIFPRTIFHWDVNSVADINSKSLSLFWMLEPKIDILLIGTGDEGLTIDQDVRIFLKQKNISCEIMSSSRAAAEFNWLNVDNRNVAAALIPPIVDSTIDTEEAWDNQAAKRTQFLESRSYEIQMKDFWRSNKELLDFEKKKVEEKSRKKTYLKKDPRE